MKTEEEVQLNVMKFNKEEIPDSLRSIINNQTKNCLLKNGVRLCKCAKNATKSDKNYKWRAVVNKESCILCVTVVVIVLNFVLKLYNKVIIR